MKKNVVIGWKIGQISEELILFQNVLTFLSYYKVSCQCINILDILQSYYCSLSQQFGGNNSPLSGQGVAEINGTSSHVLSGELALWGNIFFILWMIQQLCECCSIWIQNKSDPWKPHLTMHRIQRIHRQRPCARHHRTILEVLYPCLNGSEPSLIRGGASVVLALPTDAWSDCDLGNLEARSTPVILD